MAFYVYKDGRCISDYNNYDDALKQAQEIGGEVAADIDTGSRPSDMEILKNFSARGWIVCGEETYPVDGENDCVIIAYWEENDKKWYYWKYEDCPYGWNVLCRSKAYWKQIDAPYVS